MKFEACPFTNSVYHYTNILELDMLNEVDCMAAGAAYFVHNQNVK
jgi:hypothetical protein